MTEVNADTNNDVIETSFGVEGMFCGGCAAAVERTLNKMQGVTDVSAAFLSNSTVVLHDPSLVTKQELEQQLSSLGYETHALESSAAIRSRNTYQRSHQIRLAIAVGFGMWVMLAGVARYFTDLPEEILAWWVGIFSGLFSIPVLTYSGIPFYRLGWRGLLARVPGMESLILIATIAAVSASVWNLINGNPEVWFEVPVMLILFQLVARLSDFGARRHAADAVRAMLDLSPEQAWLVDSNGTHSVLVSRLKSGDTIESRAGERLAVDGEIISGTASLNTALLSGESLPVTVNKGDSVLAGTLNIDGSLMVRVTAGRGERTLDQLAATVGRALNRKSDLMRLLDLVASYLVPVICIAACIAFVIAISTGHSAADATIRALAVLVVSCPCALSLAIPLVIATSVATAANQGVILRDPASIEQARKINTVLFDKTGTLTTGELNVQTVVTTQGYTEHDVLKLGAFIESASNHPLAKAIVNHARPLLEHKQESTSEIVRSLTPKTYELSERLEKAGAGVQVMLPQGQRLLAGSARWLEECNIEGIPEPHNHASSRVVIAIDQKAVGAFELADTLRQDTPALLKEIRALGLNPILVSGDSKGAVAAVGDELKMEWHAAQSPDQKAEIVKEMQSKEHRVAFVGDGLNDAPALAAADLGIATGGASDLAKTAAAMSVQHGGLEQILTALRITRKASKVLVQNLIWALLYNAILLPAAVFGYVSPVMAALAMILSSVSVSVNSMRLIKTGKTKSLV